MDRSHPVVVCAAVEQRVHRVEAGGALCGAVHVFDAAVLHRAGDSGADCARVTGSVAAGKRANGACGVRGFADSCAVSERLCVVAAAGAAGGDFEFDRVDAAAVYGGVCRRGVG